MEENKIEFINESKMELAENLNKSENIKENIGNSSNHDSIFLQIIKAVAFSGIISIALLGILMKAHARANDHFSWLKSTFSSVANENEALYGVARNNFMFKLYIVFIILIFVFLCWFYFKKMENKVLKALTFVPFLLLLASVYYFVFEGTSEFGGGYGPGPGFISIIISWIILFPFWVFSLVKFITLNNLKNKINKADKILSIFMFLSPVLLPIASVFIANLILLFV